ncbi:9071_t:CDS:2 [Scutellospora calospora]|uniref:9071_t:CDS:1 n=1 Tax=Scutellospora calospora TaxID=85575 RepID=A0ACA9M2P3_9GLOM|nr:9071_t:CDS:2 [Scutellospora calospora]
MCDCWKSNPNDRPSILNIVEYFYGKIKETMKNSNDSFVAIQSSTFNSSIIKSQLHKFNNFMKTRDATKEEQEEFDNLSEDDNFYNNNNELKLSYRSLQDDFELGIPLENPYVIDSDEAKKNLLPD